MPKLNPYNLYIYSMINFLLNPKITMYVVYNYIVRIRTSYSVPKASEYLWYTLGY